MITVNPNPAQNVTVDVQETFDEFATRIHDRRSAPLLFENGESIVLNPDAVTCVMGIEMARPLTPEEFTGLFGTLKEWLKQAEAAGTIPPHVVGEISTLFNLVPPSIPQRYKDETPEATFKVTWEGTQRFLIEREE